MFKKRYEILILLTIQVKQTQVIWDVQNREMKY